MHQIRSSRYITCNPPRSSDPASIADRRPHSDRTRTAHHRINVSDQISWRGMRHNISTVGYRSNDFMLSLSPPTWPDSGATNPGGGEFAGASESGAQATIPSPRDFHTMPKPTRTHWSNNYRDSHNTGAHPRRVATVADELLLPLIQHVFSSVI
jgi:hypothetical protein